MALDANADDLLTLGFTSITAYSKLFGFKEAKLFEIEEYKKENINVNFED